MLLIVNFDKKWKIIFPHLGIVKNALVCFHIVAFPDQSIMQRQRKTRSTKWNMGVLMDSLLSGSWDRFTNDSSNIINILAVFIFTLISLVAVCALRTFAHSTAALLLIHVQYFVTITLLQWLRAYEMSIQCLVMMKKIVNEMGFQVFFIEQK